VSINYNFEWDPQKAQSNIKKHHVRFEEAATVFLDPIAVSIYDTVHSEREDRWITMEVSKTNRILIVCHSFREENADIVTIRIFSSRKANKTEIQKYEGK
jgi:uncharacterized DUF497 family protein